MNALKKTPQQTPQRNHQPPNQPTNQPKKPHQILKTKQNKPAGKQNYIILPVFLYPYLQVSLSLLSNSDGSSLAEWNGESSLLYSLYIFLRVI